MNKASLLAAFLIVSPCAFADERATDNTADEDAKKAEHATHELGHVLQQRAPARQGNPDRPVITGRVPNPAGADDRPVENLSLNFEKIRATSVRVTSTHRQKSRVIVRGWDSKFYALPDGSYASDPGQGIVVSGGAVREKASGDVVIKGKKILQNYLPDGRFVGPGGAWIEIRNGKIATVGGQLERHKPPPLIDVNDDGSLRK